MFVAMCLCVFVLITVVEQGQQTPWTEYIYLVVSLVAFILGSMMYSSVRGSAWDHWNTWLRGNVDIFIEPYREEETAPVNEENTETNL